MTVTVEFITKSNICQSEKQQTQLQEERCDFLLYQDTEESVLKYLAPQKKLHSYIVNCKYNS